MTTLNKLFIVILVSFLCLPTQAATYYVATTGSDSNDGSSGTPWLTMQKAFNTVSANDVVILNTGTYSGTATTATAGPITVRSATQDYNDVLYSSEITVDHSDYTFEGIRIRYLDVQATAHRTILTNCWNWSTNGGHWTWSMRGDDWIIDSCLFKGAKADGSSGKGMIWANNGSRGTIRNSVFTENNGHDCMQLFGTGHVVERNWFTNLTTAGQAVGPAHSDHSDLWQGYSNSSTSRFQDHVFRYNIVSNSFMSALFQISNAANSPYYTGMDVYGNVIVDSKIQCNIYTDGFRFINNTVIDTKGHATGIRWTTSEPSHGTATNGEGYNNLFLLMGGPESGAGVIGSRTGATTGYNIITDEDNTGFDTFTPGTGTVNGGYTVAQLVTDYANGDYTPVASSIADHGNGTSYASRFTVDMNGNPYDQTGWVIGAFAATGGTPTAPTAPSALSATAAGSSEIDLAWTDNASDETGFHVYRSLTSGSGFAQIATIGAPNTTSYSDTGLDASTTYYYKVSAYNGVGESSLTAEASDTTSASTAVLGYLSDNLLEYIQATNTTASQSISITNTGSGTLNWTAYVGGSPFAISGATNGALTAAQTTTITVDYAPTSAGVDDDTLTITGGGGGTVALKGLAYVVQPATAIDVTLATLENRGGAEWIQTNDYIYAETTTTDPAEASRAVLGFELSSSGVYHISGLVNAATFAKDSFLFNINAAPDNETNHLWDVLPSTVGYEARKANLRTNGTAVTPGAWPMQVDLDAGTGYIDLRPREAETYIKSLEITPTTPTSGTATVGGDVRVGF